MAGPVLHVGAVATCPHGMGKVSILSTNMRVLVGGQPVATVADMGIIAGCAFTVRGPKPQPCTSVQWIAPAARVTVNGQPVLLQSGVHLCVSADQIPAGPPVVVVCQLRVVAQ